MGAPSYYAGGLYVPLSSKDGLSSVVAVLSRDDADFAAAAPLPALGPFSGDATWVAVEYGSRTVLVGGAQNRSRVVRFSLHGGTANGTRLPDLSLNATLGTPVGATVPEPGLLYVADADAGGVLALNLTTGGVSPDPVASLGSGLRVIGLANLWDVDSQGTMHLLTKSASVGEASQFPTIHSFSFC